MILSFELVCNDPALFCIRACSGQGAPPLYVDFPDTGM
jgi:hypothetical protein